MKQLIALSILVIFLVPVIGFASEPPAGLVPCGDSGDASCQTCHIYTLIENVFEWIFGLASIVVTIIIILGGMRLVTSRGNQMAKRDARKIIGSAVVGFVMILASWMLVELLLAVLTGDTVTANIFDSIECVTQPVPTSE